MTPDIIADRYTLEEKVGEGSYSVVFRGYDRQERRKVAIKEMKHEHLPLEEAQDAQRVFFNEINILKNLHQINLPKVFDFFIFGGRHYMVMEWCEGRNLITIMEESRDEHLSQKEALNYMQQVCDALIYLQYNTRMIVYKDLKPSNIIVNDAGKIKLIDFGTARIYSPQKKKDTMVLGTPGYAPPEAYTGAQTDLSADVYSFGATFYHLLTGEEPFQFRFNFPDPRTYNSNLDGEISDILMDCLKNRDKRIKDAFLLRKRVYGIKQGKTNERRGEQFNSEKPEYLMGIQKIFSGLMPLSQLLMIIIFLFVSVYAIEMAFHGIIIICQEGALQTSNLISPLYSTGYLVFLFILQYSKVIMSIKWGSYAWSSVFDKHFMKLKAQGNQFNSFIKGFGQQFFHVLPWMLWGAAIGAAIYSTNTSLFGKGSFLSLIGISNMILPILLLLLIASKILIPIYSFIKWGFYAITPTDVIKPAALVETLKRRIHNGEKRIYSLLTGRSREIVENLDTSSGFSLMEIIPIIFDLNDIIRGISFYEKDSFKYHVLNPEAEDLIRKGAHNLDRFEKNRLNRLLLEGVFPDSLKSSPLVTRKEDFMMMNIVGGIIAVAIIILGMIFVRFMV